MMKPGMDGKELLTRLKTQHKYLEVIILTGHGSLGSAVEFAKLGVTSYKPKPYQQEELLHVLQDACLARMKKKAEDDEAVMAQCCRRRAVHFKCRLDPHISPKSCVCGHG